MFGVVGLRFGVEGVGRGLLDLGSNLQDSVSFALWSTCAGEVAFLRCRPERCGQGFPGAARLEVNLKPQTLNPKPQTLNLKNPKP